MTVANRAGPFGPQGFPKPISPPGSGPWHRILHHPRVIVAGAAAAVLAAGAIVAGVAAGPHPSPSVGPAGGSARGSVTITVTSTSLVALNGKLTVNPGGHAITVVLSISL